MERRLLLLLLLLVEVQLLLQVRRQRHRVRRQRRPLVLRGLLCRGGLVSGWRSLLLQVHGRGRKQRRRLLRPGIHRRLRRPPQGVICRAGVGAGLRRVLLQQLLRHRQGCGAGALKVQRLDAGADLLELHRCRRLVRGAVVRVLRRVGRPCCRGTLCCMGP